MNRDDPQYCILAIIGMVLMSATGIYLALVQDQVGMYAFDPVH